MDKKDAVRLQCELELFKTVFLLTVLEKIPMESAFSIVCLANKDIMDFMEIFPLDIAKHFFIIVAVSRDLDIMMN